MITVVALVCSIGDPLMCREERLGFMAQTVTPWQCSHYGQTALAKWSTEHPGWRVVKWGCRRAGQTAKA